MHSSCMGEHKAAESLLHYCILQWAYCGFATLLIVLQHQVPFLRDSHHETMFLSVTYFIILHLCLLSHFSARMGSHVQHLRKFKIIMLIVFPHYAVRNRDESILIIFSPIFLSSNSFSHLLYSISYSPPTKLAQQLMDTVNHERALYNNYTPRNSIHAQAHTHTHTQWF